MPPIEFKILILENSIIIQKGIYRIFIESGFNCSIFFATNLDDLKHTLKSREIDLVISNVSFFFNDINSLKLLKSHFPDTIWTGFQYSYSENQLLQEFSYVFQINDNQDTFISKVKELTQEDSNSDIAHTVNLTTREVEVLKLLVVGFSNKEIADKLNLSIHTVNTHRKNITQKSGIKSLAALIIFAVSKNYIHIDSLES
jgi:DNA-binding NarL/FixJ family response regulator